MKVDIESKVEFNPVTLKITFETQEEINKFYHLFNFTPFSDYIPQQAQQITDVLYRKNGSQGVGDLNQHIKNHPVVKYIFGKE